MRTGAREWFLQHLFFFYSTFAKTCWLGRFQAARMYTKWWLFLLHVSRDHYCCCYLFYFIFCWWCVTTLEMYAYVLFPMFAYIDLYHFDIEIHKYERKMEDYGTSNFFFIDAVSIIIVIIRHRKKPKQMLCSPYLN